MYKFAEQLMDRYLKETIEKTTQEVCDQNFDSVFHAVIVEGSNDDSTMGETFSRLEKMAHEALSVKFEPLINEVDSGICEIRIASACNPFALIVSALWDEFYSNCHVKGYVETFISDVWQDKQQELYKAGIIDVEGDYIPAL